jgi:hypothetical protein
VANLYRRRAFRAVLAILATFRISKLLKHRPAQVRFSPPPPFSLISAVWTLTVWLNYCVVDIGFGQRSRGREPDFVQRLYSRFAFLALLAFLAFLEISNLRVLNTRHGFDSRRLHQFMSFRSRPWTRARDLLRLRWDKRGAVRHGSSAQSSESLTLESRPAICRQSP